MFTTTCAKSSSILFRVTAQWVLTCWSVRDIARATRVRSTEYWVLNHIGFNRGGISSIFYHVLSLHLDHMLISAWFITPSCDGCIPHLGHQSWWVIKHPGIGRLQEFFKKRTPSRSTDNFTSVSIEFHGYPVCQLINDMLHRHQLRGTMRRLASFPIFLMLDNKEILKELKVLNSSIVMTGNDW